MHTLKYIIKFLVCLIYSEIKNLKVNIGYIKYIFLHTNFLKFIYYIFNNNINPIKSKKINNFLYLN